MIHRNSIISLTVLALVLPGIGLQLFASESDRPNIVFILSDDQAWSDYGFMGHPDIQTPHLDALAEQSLVFERGYVASPLCRPSLASMVTGLYPFQHGITGNDVDGRNNRAALDLPIREKFHRHPGFIRMLTESGYLSHQSGKWWEGSFSDGGFTHGMTHGDPKRRGRHGDEGLKIGREGMQPVTEFIDHALAEQKPFLIWYAPFLPHTPHNPPDRLLEKYTRNDRAKDVAKYMAMCEWFDDSCGELIGCLENRNIRENTLVIYICDNGWAAKSTNISDPNQKNWGSFALRSKGSPFENGVRTPIMLSWPKQLKPQRCPGFAHAIDLFPTIAAAANLKAPENLSGINLLDEVKRSARKKVFGVTHAIHNMTPGQPDDTLQYLWCIDGPWKLIQRFDGNDTTKYKKVHSWDKAPVRLYHLDKDPAETDNLAGKHPEKVEQMKQAVLEWRRSFE